MNTACLDDNNTERVSMNITDDDDDSFEDVITQWGEDGYDQVAHTDNHHIITHTQSSME